MRPLRPGARGAPKPRGRFLKPLSRGRPSFARGVRFVVVVMGLAGAMTASACSEIAKYRVLSFFFDGVPKPAALVPRTKAPRATTTAPKPAPRERKPRAAIRRAYRHVPYAEDRCGACHNPDGGQLFRTPEEGLCQSCHPDVPGEVKYVHGPVAVNACLDCHHYHKSFHTSLLLENPKAICFGCHDQDDIEEGEQHAAIEDQRCVECHDPHGGGNGFFLKRIER